MTVLKVKSSLNDFRDSNTHILKVTNFIPVNNDTYFLSKLTRHGLGGMRRYYGLYSVMEELFRRNRDSMDCGMSQRGQFPQRH